MLLLIIGIIMIGLGVWLFKKSPVYYPPKVIGKYPLKEGESRLRIAKTVLPPKRLKKNAWYQHISDLRNGKI